MYKTIKTLVKLALLLFAVALILDLHYEGRSIRQWSKEYAWKASNWVYGQSKALVGKDLKDLTPSALPKLEDALKSIGNDSTNDTQKNDVKKSLENNDSSKDQSKKAETSKASVSKLDQLTDQDRAKLRELLEQKSKSKPSSL